MVIAAPGMVWRRLEVEGIEELLGRGVYYGAGRSEATQCGGDPVVVVGAGNSAGQAVMNLAESGARVTMAVRGEDLGKSMSQYLVRRIEEQSGDRREAADRGRGRGGGWEQLSAVALCSADGARRAGPGPGAVPLPGR